jgi:hypothetical protein
MREPERVSRILTLLEEKWIQAPDMRFGQLLINLRLVADNNQVWNREDDETEQLLRDFRWSK